MQHTVGVADMKIATGPDDVIVTYALGSCLGITLYDPVAKVGGMLHVMMPVSSVNPDKAKSNPYMFVDTGIPAFFKAMYANGASKNRMIVKVAGGANTSTNGEDRFAIGKRNFITLKKLLWKNSVMIKAEDVGDNKARTMYLETDSGRTWLKHAGEKWDLQ